MGGHEDPGQLVLELVQSHPRILINRVDHVFDGLVLLRLRVVEGELLKLRLHLVETQTVGDRRIDL